MNADKPQTTGVEFDAEVFKAQLLSLCKAEGVKVCAEFEMMLTKCNSSRSIIKHLELYGEEIAERLGVDTDPFDTDAFDEGRVSDLEDEVRDLENELEELKEILGDLTDDHTLHTELKIRCFIENRDRFTLDEFETIMCKVKLTA